MSYKGVDLKIFLDDEILNWYNNEINYFYVITSLNGEIISHSDNIYKHFNLDNNANILEIKLNDLISDANWNDLNKKIETISYQNDFIELPEYINNKIYNVKWNKKQFDDKYYVYFIFKASYADEIKETEEISNKHESEIILYEQLNIPFVIINDNEFIFKNTLSEKLLNESNINDFNLFISWLKNNIKSEIFNKEKNHQYLKSMINDKFYLVLIINYTPTENKLLILFLEFENEKTENDIEKIQEELNYTINKLNIEKDELIKSNSSYKNEIEILYNKLENLTQIENESFSIEDKKDDEITVFVKTTTTDVSKLKDLSGMIEEISIKIHLISINAAIESARIGESGKGFAVISKEIAKLSDFTKNYAKMLNVQINNIIENINKNIKKFSDENLLKKDKLVANVIDNLKYEVDKLKKII